MWMSSPSQLVDFHILFLLDLSEQLDELEE